MNVSSIFQFKWSMSCELEKSWISALWATKSWGRWRRVLRTTYCNICFCAAARQNALKWCARALEIIGNPEIYILRTSKCWGFSPDSNTFYLWLQEIIPPLWSSNSILKWCHILLNISRWMCHQFFNSSDRCHTNLRNLEFQTFGPPKVEKDKGECFAPLIIIFAFAQLRAKML